jgi:hypothetical protein
MLAARFPPVPLYQPSSAPGRRQLQAAADAWLITSNYRRRNHRDYMPCRTPQQIFAQHPTQPGS